MNNEWIPSIITNGSHWNVDNFLLYDKSGFVLALVQFIHRNLAYLIFLFTVLLVAYLIRVHKGKRLWIALVLLGIIVVQITLGILTLLGSYGSIPVMYGALHQGVGILFLTFLVYLLLITKPIYNR
jgi:cytochrome c oxidase assembly protein subunit 15